MCNDFFKYTLIESITTTDLLLWQARTRLFNRMISIKQQQQQIGENNIHKFLERLKWDKEVRSLPKDFSAQSQKLFDKLDEVFAKMFSQRSIQWRLVNL